MEKCIRNVSELKHYILEYNGIYIVLIMLRNYKLFYYSGVKYKLRFQALLCDLPAKSAILETKQFNGEFGCLTCYHPGEYSIEFRKRIYVPEKKVILRFKK